MNRVIPHTRWFCLAALAVFGNTGAVAAEAVLLLKSRDLAPFDQAADGFAQQWKQLAPGCEIVQRTLVESAPDGGLSPAAVAKPLAVVAVVAVGTEAARWALRHTDRPVVFCMVGNARQSLLDGLSKHDRDRVTGVLLNIPARAQFELLRGVMPDAKKIGVIFDPQKSAAAVREAAAAAAELGMELVTREVASEAALAGATAWIAPRIDALWAPVDSTVFNSRSAQFVLLQMLQHKVPVLGFSENMVKAGALLAPRVNYGAVGRQTAELLAAALKASAPAAVDLQPPRTFDLVVNGHVSRVVGKHIVSTAQQPVSVINED